MTEGFSIRTLGPGDLDLYYAMLDMFGAAFEDPGAYRDKQPAPAYAARMLASDSFIALVAATGERVVGGLASYELRKFEQERSEFYIYDLAVDEAARRQGIATALIERLQRIAAERGGYVIFVQADHGDNPAIALYTGLGACEDVMHFDIPVAPSPGK